MPVAAVVFDVGNVLYRWEPEALYRELIPDAKARAAFMREVVTLAWHDQHDQGRDFSDTSAELIACFPQHAALIAQWGPRFEDSITGPMPGMIELVSELDALGVPLYGITNFSHEFWPPFRAKREAVFSRFRDIIVSGVERLAKPDRAIFHLALARFGLAEGAGLFIDDSLPNIEAARACGFQTHHFQGDVAALRRLMTREGVL